MKSVTFKVLIIGNGCVGRSVLRSQLLKSLSSDKMRCVAWDISAEETPLERKSSLFVQLASSQRDNAPPVESDPWSYMRVSRPERGRQRRKRFVQGNLYRATKTRRDATAKLRPMHSYHKRYSNYV